MSRVRLVALAAGPAAAVALWLLPPAAGMTAAGQAVAGLAVWMAIWWLTSVLPLEATALLPLIVLPLAGAFGIEDAARPYADPIVFVFMGGFFLAAASSRSNLHRRLALAVLSLVGADAARVVAAIMGATAFISMWMSNTATAAMMLPLVVALNDLARRASPETAKPFGIAVTLGMAYAASIGGIATLIGTPPTAILAASAKQLAGRAVGFGEWMLIGVPLALALLVVCWFVLVRVVQRVRGPLAGITELLAAERKSLGPWTRAQRVTVAVLALTTLAWILREPKTMGAVTIPGLTTFMPGVSDAGIAIAASVALFVVGLLDWDAARKIPWDVLLLFGGGLSLAAAFEGSGLAAWLGGRLGGLAGAPAVVVIGAVTLFFIFLTELTSNTATAAMAMPLAASLAPALGVPALALMGAAALGSSMGFMLPVGTPPNALALGTEAVTTRDMARAGIWLDVVGGVLITLAMLLWT